MHFCAFLQLSKFNIRCNVNLMFAKSLFSEIFTQKAHFAQLGPFWGASAGPEDAADRVRQSASCFQSRTGLKVEPKSKRSPKSKGHPLPKSRMILREKISGKVELSLYYALLFHCSGICPVFLLIPHAVLLQTRVFQLKSDRVQEFSADKVERV